MIGITPGFEPLALSLCQSLAESGPMRVDEFDDAWTPAGENYRDELVSGGLVTIDEVVENEGEDPVSLIVLTGAGVALASAAGTVEPATAQQP